MTARKILCVDDDAYLTDLLRYALAREGYSVTVASSGAEAQSMARSDPPDLVILDGNLPDVSGFELCGRLRATLRVPVIMLTARQADEDVIAGLGNGADDYITKPFNMQILAHRVRAVLRRAHAAVPSDSATPLAYTVGTGTYDTENNELLGPTMRVKLTRTEGEILRLLLAHEGQVFSSMRMLERIWGHNTEREVNVIKTHVHHLRMKLDESVGASDLVQTVPGVGYTLRRAALAASDRTG